MPPKRAAIAAVSLMQMDLATVGELATLPRGSRRFGAQVVLVFVQGKFVGAPRASTRLARLQLAGLLSFMARNWAGYRALCISSVIF